MVAVVFSRSLKERFPRPRHRQAGAERAGILTGNHDAAHAVGYVGVLPAVGEGDWNPRVLRFQKEVRRLNRTASGRYTFIIFIALIGLKISAFGWSIYNLSSLKIQISKSRINICRGVAKMNRQFMNVPERGRSFKQRTTSSQIIWLSQRSFKYFSLFAYHRWLDVDFYNFTPGTIIQVKIMIIIFCTN